MPLPHFLLMLVAVILSAGATLFAAFKAGVPLVALALLALTGAGLLHLTAHDNES